MIISKLTFCRTVEKLSSEKHHVLYIRGMGIIYEPIEKIDIIFRYLSWAPDKKSHRYYEDRFTDIPALKRYFERFPGAGSLVKYGKTKPHEHFAFSAIIILEWVDRVGTTVKEFEDVYQFIDFLKEYPPLAKAVQFEPKA